MTGAEGCAEIGLLAHEIGQLPAKPLVSRRFERVAYRVGRPPGALQTLDLLVTGLGFRHPVAGASQIVGRVEQLLLENVAAVRIGDSILRAEIGHAAAGFVDLRAQVGQSLVDDGHVALDEQLARGLQVGDIGLGHGIGEAARFVRLVRRNVDIDDVGALGPAGRDGILKDIDRERAAHGGIGRRRLDIAPEQPREEPRPR